MEQGGRRVGIKKNVLSVPVTDSSTITISSLTTENYISQVVKFIIKLILHWASVSVVKDRNWDLWWLSYARNGLGWARCMRMQQ